MITPGSNHRNLTMLVSTIAVAFRKALPMLQARQKISICYFYKLTALGLSGSLDISSSSDNLKVKIQHTSYFNYIIHAYSLNGLNDTTFCDKVCQ